LILSPDTRLGGPQHPAATGEQTGEQNSEIVDAFANGAIRQALEQFEPGDAFNQLADERWEGLLATGQSVPWDKAKPYLEAKARSESPPRPDARHAPD
jgi:hypothetical protein